MNILISVICFINRNKPGAEIYGTFAKRTINDVMTKTPCDIMVTTNERKMFQEEIETWGNRVIVREDKLINHRLTVGVFNQLLKFFSIKDISKIYDYVLYLDCDAGLTNDWDMDLINSNIKKWESEGYDMMVTRTNCILGEELIEHERRVAEEKYQRENGNPNFYNSPQLFSGKFRFYEVSTKTGPFEWFPAILPSEHILFIKNNEKLVEMCRIFEDFCYKFETQGQFPITEDMEAFEIGVSALLAGYKVGDMKQLGEKYVFNVGFNKNNIERVKY